MRRLGGGRGQVVSAWIFAPQRRGGGTACAPGIHWGPTWDEGKWPICFGHCSSDETADKHGFMLARLQRFKDVGKLVIEKCSCHQLSRDWSHHFLRQALAVCVY